MRKARGVSETELFRSSSDLLEGRARIWFDARQGTFANWSEFKARFLKVFLPVNYQDELEAEIKNRKQGPSESVKLYVASMMELFARLPEPFDNAKKLRTICRNLRLSLQQSLTFSPVNDLDTLIEVCCRLEENELRMGMARLPYSSARRLLEPELSGIRFRGHDVTPRHREVAGIDTLGNSGGSCYNCSQGGLFFRDCPEPRRIFCHGCGAPNLKYYQCPRCAEYSPGNRNFRNQTSGGSGEPNLTDVTKPNPAASRNSNTPQGNNRRGNGRQPANDNRRNETRNRDQENNQRPAQTGVTPVAPP